MNLGEKSYWIAFSVFQGIGPLRFKLLIDYFKTAEKAYNAKKEELLKVGLSDKIIDRFINFRSSFDITSYLLRLEQYRIITISYDEDNYPMLLKEVIGKPIVIFVKIQSNSRGETSDSLIKKILNQKSIAVVGARKVTGYGRQVTEIITQGLVESGLVVISGLARGVDGIAHQTAINCQGITIGVLGCGLDRIYPPEHVGLAKQIIESGGAIISEFPLGMQAVPGNFPARNRIISGLSLGVVITEAAEDSGSLITASSAAEQGREVFAIPGPITSPMSEGTAQLLKKGAKLVTRVEDILDELGINKRIAYGVTGVKSTASRVDLTTEETKIIELIQNENLHIDEIARKLNWDSSKVGGTLSLMEVRGMVRSLGEGNYSLN